MSNRIYEQQLNYYRELNDISSQMLQFSTEQLTDDEQSLVKFQELLDARQSLLAAIDALVEKSGLKNKEQNYETSQALLATLHREAAKLQDKNLAIEGLVQTALAELRNRVKKVQEGRHSSRSYEGPVVAGEGSFIDKRR